MDKVQGGTLPTPSKMILLKGKFIIGHILVIAIACTCFLLSSWQFSRLQERKDLNATIEASMSQDTVKLGDILLPGDTKEVVKEAEYRRVNVSGVYNKEGEILILGRARDGDPGYLVMTPLTVVNINDDFASKEVDVVYINRGWIPQTLGDGLRDESVSQAVIAPHGGYDERRTVSGLIRSNERKVLFSDDEQVSDLVTNRIDTNLFRERAGVNSEHMYPLWIHQLSESIKGKSYPVEGEVDKRFPRLLDSPELSERNHLSYAVQWIIFGLIAVITWCVICYKAVEKEKKRNARITQ